MGVILRQGFKHSIVTTIATIIGMLNVLFIYTYVLTKEELGLYRYLVSIAQLIAPFLLLGFGQVSVRFFSTFEQKKEKNNGFLFFLLIVPLIAFILFVIACLFFKDKILASYVDHPDAQVLYKYLPLVPFLILALMISGLLTKYTANFKRIVVPEIFSNLWLKIAIPILAIAYFFEYIIFYDFIIYTVIAHLLSSTALALYLGWLGKLNLRPNFNLFKPKLLKEIRYYAAYALMGGMGTLIATRIDTYMVGTLIDMEETGVYSIALFIATVIGIPSKSIFRITTPIIAQLWHDNNLPNINKLYRKTALNLLVVGLLLLIGIWASIDLLFEVIPNGDGYKAGKYVVLLLGLAKIIGMVTGLSSSVIMYSYLYRFNFYMSLILAVLNIVFNLIFIPLYGIVGVALATLSSIFIFNLLKYLFVLVKFKMQPFSWQMMGVLALALIAYLSTFLIPKSGIAFLDIIINSICITLIYVPGILYFNFSEDLTLLKQTILKKGRAFLEEHLVLKDLLQKRS